MEYTLRKWALEKEKTYGLTKEGIEVADHEGNKTLYPYSDMVLVHTSYTASKNNAFYQCKLKMGDKSSILLKSQHYRGLADFEDRNEEYSAFIQGLHKLLALANPDVTYKKGIGIVGYIASVIIFIITGVLFLPLISISALFTGNMLYGIVGIIASIFLIIKMVKYTKKNKPGKYTPDSIPTNLLPVGG